MCERIVGRGQHFALCIFGGLHSGRLHTTWTGSASHDSNFQGSNFRVSPTTKGKSVVNPCLSLNVERLTTTATCVLAVSVYPDPVPVKLKLLKL